LVYEIREALSYDDVLLVPKFSNIFSRKQVETSTHLTRNIKLNIPIISSNMDSVTESSMVIAMARQGGLGIIHRYLSVEDQVNEVLKVKRSEAIVIERPYTLTPDHMIRDARNLMNEKKISGIPIVDNVGRYVGILTSKDLMFEDNILKSISEIMTTKENSITALPDINSGVARDIFKENKIEKLPLVDRTGMLRGLITSKDIMKNDIYPLASKDSKGRLLVGAAIGVKGDYLDRAEALINSGCDILCVDVAHGHHENVIQTIKAIKDRFGDVPLIAGNVATSEGTLDLINAGADCIKVGVGGGCFAAGTRILMSNGIYKNIEDIKSGEKIINKNGKSVNVKNAFCTGVKLVHKIRSSIFYQPTFVTLNHSYWVGDLNTISIATLQSRGYAKLLEVQSKTIPKSSKYKWKEVKDLKQDVLLIPKEIQFELENDFKITLNKRVSGNAKSGIKYDIDSVLKPNYDLGYIFGTFLGDGTAHQGANKKNNSHVGSARWFFGLEELDIAEKLSKSINNIFKKEAKIVYSKKNTIDVRFFYKPFADFLQAFGKKHNKYLPNQYLINNREYLTGLLHGLIDSDGYLEDGGRIAFYNSSKKLIELFSIVNYILTGVFPNCEKEKIDMGNLKGTKIENIKPSYTARIINTGEKRLTKNYQLAKILENKETNQSVPVYDLEIDCPTHSFIANNAIVHNSICVTRIVAGSGIPQFTAVLDSAKVAHEVGIPVIADGGIKQAGDITKALGAGASCVMLGNMLAGTDESPGQTIIKNGRKFKIYRGMAGFGANMSKRQRENINDDLSDVVPEGVEGIVPYRGNVSEVVFQLIGGLKSGMSYAGAHTIYELWKNAEFIKMTSSGIKESQAHDIDLLK